MIIPEAIFTRIMHLASVLETDEDAQEMFPLLVQKLLFEVCVLQRQSEELIIPEPIDEDQVCPPQALPSPNA